MKKTIYTPDQVELLKSNGYIKECTSKYISFTDDCKINALKLDSERWYFKDIFRYFGFPDFFIDSEAPLRTMKNWRHTMRTKGLANMIGQKKGRKKQIDTSQMSKDEYIEYLEAKTAYLEELQERMYGKYP